MAKELNNFVLSAIAIIGLTVIVLTGMAVSANYSKVLRTTTTITGVNTTVTDSLEANGTATIMSDYPFVQSMSICSNSSDGTFLPAANYTVSEGDKNGGIITLEDGSSTWEGTGLNCSELVYLANSAGQSAADKFTTGLGAFGTFAVIIILAIVGKAIIGLFKRKE